MCVLCVVSVCRSISNVYFLFLFSDSYEQAPNILTSILFSNIKHYNKFVLSFDILLSKHDMHVPLNI